MSHKRQKTPKKNISPLKFTYRDYCLLPDDGHRYEIINGELYNAPAPFVVHQQILANLNRQLDAYCRERRHGTLLFAPVDVVFSDVDVVQPDILWISRERTSILTKKNLQGAPDLVVEITSPGTKEKDENIKLKLYQKFGVKEFWLLDPERQVLSVFQRKGRMLKLIQKYSEIESFESPLFPGLRINLQEVFV